MQLSGIQRLEMRDEIVTILRPFFKRTANFPEGAMSHYSDCATSLTNYFEAKMSLYETLTQKPKSSGSEDNLNPNG